MTLDLKPSQIITGLVAGLSIVFFIAVPIGVAVRLGYIPISIDFLLGALAGGLGIAIGLIVIIYRQQVKTQRLQAEMMHFMEDQSEFSSILKEKFSPSIQIDRWSVKENQINLKLKNIGTDIAKDLRLVVTGQAVDEMESSTDSVILTTSELTQSPETSHTNQRNEYSGTSQGVVINPSETTQLATSSPVEFTLPDFREELNNPVKSIRINIEIEYTSQIGNEYEKPLFSVTIDPESDVENIEDALYSGRLDVIAKDADQEFESYGDSRRVLIVDDEPDVAETFRLWLHDDYDVVVANSGQEALEILDPSIDVVLLDRMMPNMSGDQLLSRIRDSELDCGIIIISAVDPDWDILEMDFDQYLSKPITSKQLNNAVEDIFNTLNQPPLVREYLKNVHTLSILIQSKSDEELKENSEIEELKSRVVKQKSKIRQQYGIESLKSMDEILS